MAAARLPGRFAAIAPVGGNAEDVHDFAKLAGTAVWIAHNVDDGTIPFAEALEAAEQVEQVHGAEFHRTTPAAISSN